MSRGRAGVERGLSGGRAGFGGAQQRERLTSVRFARPAQAHAS
ncbi:hypothetical protein HMPREF1318_1835 [Actinomyces massiliensis F0489]|uniref:Uncharacterized protein n=1 Tax=Actinomyces massiliensis F0489 TaxID=1125718 RepID=J1HPY9_9ACTO|nr:hypothetical protein HMPREF1318_1835 [Actinomyces massiliensis F0489]